MKWLRKLFGLKDAEKPLVSVPLAPDWTESHADELRRFLDSPAGKDFMAKARAMEFHYCREACAGKLEPKMASGISFTLDWLQSLTKISSAVDANTANSETRSQADAEFLNETAYA